MRNSLLSSLITSINPYGTYNLAQIQIPLLVSMSILSSDSEQSMQDTHQPPEEYHHILNQFRTRNWSSIHKPQPEQNGPLIDSSERDMLEDAMLDAESRRHSRSCQPFMRAQHL